MNVWTKEEERRMSICIYLRRNAEKLNIEDVDFYIDNISRGITPLPPSENKNKLTERELRILRIVGFELYKNLESETIQKIVDGINKELKNEILN